MSPHGFFGKGAHGFFLKGAHGFRGFPGEGTLWGISAQFPAADLGRLDDGAWTGVPPLGGFYTQFANLWPHGGKLYFRMSTGNVQEFDGTTFVNTGGAGSVREMTTAASLLHGVYPNAYQFSGGSWSTIATTVKLGLGTGTIWGCVEWNSELYVGGQYTTIDAVTCNRVAKHSGGAWVNAGGAGWNGRVNCLEVFLGKLYAGGTFTNADGGAANYIAVTSDGVTWSPIGTGANAQVVVLRTIGSYLYAGGIFTTMNGTAAAYIARTSDGINWSKVGDANGQVWAIREYQSAPVASGLFTQIGTFSGEHAMWDESGSDWIQLGTPTNARIADFAEIDLY